MSDGNSHQLNMDELILNEKCDATIVFPHETYGIYRCQFIAHIPASAGEHHGTS